MAKYLIIIEDTDLRHPDAPAYINIQQFVPHGEDPSIPTKAGMLARYVQMKLAELELAAEEDRKRAQGEQMEGEARCWH
jgi:hypothetical protein